MRHLQDEERRLLYLQMGLHVQHFLLMEDIQFILFQLLFLQLLSLLEELKQGVKVKILNYLFVGMLYLGPQVLMG
jgi:hypothetical protein